MKKFLIVLLPISLFVFSCEDNNVVDTSEGVKLEWIGFGRMGTNYSEFVWYVGTKPSFPQNDLLSDDYNIGWDYSYECDEIELFQSEGYFNFILSTNSFNEDTNSGIKLTYQLDNFVDMVWKE